MPPKLFQNHERVEVRCGSAGSVSIDLYNVAEHPPTSTFFVHLPPFPSPDGSPASLPGFLQDKPVASINYRWSSEEETSTINDFKSPSLQWPTPIHDTSFAYSWLVENLVPEGNQRRDIYVYGSHLGASLATSLSLTESHPHMRFAVRGGIAYNGIYNWTMFLPDHPANKPSKRVKTKMEFRRAVPGTHLHNLQEELPCLFQKPADMFDAFASPSLFFHSPGLLIPSSFFISMAETVALEALVNLDAAPAIPMKIPRKSHMVFPARQSTLKIPELLFLYDSPAATAAQLKRRPSRLAARKGNTFENQAKELVELARRSIDKVELKERSKWDEEVDSWEEEVVRRVKLVDVGEETKTLGLNELGEDAIEDWLAERIRDVKE
ncbi:Fc.00g113500.m01.CDS01 [Cosmosporella sp. VM-42]